MMSMKMSPSLLVRFLNATSLGRMPIAFLRLQKKAEESSRYADCRTLLGVRSKHGDTTVRSPENSIAYAIGSARRIWVFWHCANIPLAVREHGKIDETSTASSASGANFRGGSGDTRREIAVVINAVLVHRVQDRINVHSSLRVASISQLFSGVYGENNDACQNGNSRHDKQNF